MRLITIKKCQSPFTMNDVPMIFYTYDDKGFEESSQKRDSFFSSYKILERRETFISDEEYEMLRDAQEYQVNQACKNVWNTIGSELKEKTKFQLE